MIGPLLVAVLIGAAVLIGFVGLWRVTGARDPVDTRLDQYGTSTLESAYLGAGQSSADQASIIARAGHRLSRFRFGRRLAAMLSHANVPLTAPEFALIILGAGLVGFVFGTVRTSVIAGVLLGIILGFFPIIYLRVGIGRRQRDFTEQLPDVLTLLVGALRAGYGLSQALDVLVEQMPPPASGEFARVQRAVSLGLPIQGALNDMAQRIGTDEVDLIVTAINVQYELGGNLAETLETIGETIRDRIQMLREIRVLTAQQRMTGYILAILPFAVGVGMFFINPEYIMRLFEPGWIRILPIAALVMQLIGFLLIRRIVDIEV